MTCTARIINAQCPARRYSYHHVADKWALLYPCVGNYLTFERKTLCDHRRTTSIIPSRLGLTVGIWTCCVYLIPEDQGEPPAFSLPLFHRQVGRPYHLAHLFHVTGRAGAPWSMGSHRLAHAGAAVKNRATKSQVCIPCSIHKYLII